MIVKTVNEMAATSSAIKSFLYLTATLCLCFMVIQPAYSSERSLSALKVCADPNSPPFSTKERNGFENKIAMLIAEELALPIEYTWFPQRMGFIRSTLKSEREDGKGFKCDLVMGVPEQFELAITTDPYYHSTYALVVSADNKYNIKTPQDIPALEETDRNKLRVGMTERSPGALWMAKYDLHEQIAPYIAQSGDPNEFAGEPIMKDLVNGKIDAAIIWGPTAGLFKRLHPDLMILPLTSEPGIKFDFSISAGVRFGEKEWKNQVDQILKKNAERITKILKEYQVPLVDDKGKLLSLITLQNK